MPKRAAFVTIISVRPMMALSGVRSSWLMLETNCDLFSLAICKLAVLVLDFVEQPHVLDRDRRLVGKRGDQLDLLLGERPHLVAGQSQNADRNAFAQHGNAEHGAKSAQSLGFRPGVIRVGQHIGYVNDLAFEQSASENSSALRFDRNIPDIVVEFRREAVRLGPKEHTISLASYRSLVRIAKAGSRFDQRLKHRPEIERRAADDFEHVGGGGLLLQRFAQLVEQPRVLDGDDGLAGEILDQLDLLVA